METSRAIAYFLCICTYFFCDNGAAHILQKRLVGGRDPMPDEAKSYVAFASGKNVCGGTIIDDKLILTAAHCVGLDKTTGKLFKPSKVIAGTTDLEKRESAVVVDVAKAYVPSNFKRNDDEFLQEMPIADIAVLELRNNLKLEENGDKVQKLELPQLVDGAYSNYENAIVQAGGFGYKYVKRSHDEDYNDIFSGWSSFQLQVGKSEIVSQRECQLQHRKDLTDNQLCVKVIESLRHAGPCGGDIGSPVIFDDKVVIGVLNAYDTTCDTDAFSAVYTRVSSYVKFIENVKNGNIADITTYEV